MVKYVKPGISGDAEISLFEVSQEDSKRTAMRAVLRPDEYVPAGRYVKLAVNGVLQMKDTQFEWHSNLHAVHRATGDVLIGGLGIGMVLVPILQKPEVKSVTVIEKNGDVVKLVFPCLVDTVPEAKKLRVACADIFLWNPNMPKWDTIYFDIWPNVSTDNLEEMTKLKRRFSKRLNRDNPKAWMGCWEEETLRYRKRQEKRMEWR